MPSSSNPSTGPRRRRLAPVLCLLAAAGLALVWGCQSKIPPTSALTDPGTAENRSLVADFENQSPNINPDLFELNNPPSYTLKEANLIPGSAAFVVVNNFKSLAGVTDQAVHGPGLGANGSDYAFHEAGAVTDLGDFTYPSLDLQAQLEAGNFYDASPWKGVKFMMKVGPGDTALHRIFSIPVYQTVAVAGGGGCLAGPKLCYDHFAADYSAGTGGQWKQFSFLFSDLHQLVAGYIPTPPTLSGVNLQQVLWLQWEEGLNNSAGHCNIDLWVDDVEFF
jgi:hypothetical protein